MGLFVTVSEKKWNKSKDIIAKLSSQFFFYSPALLLLKIHGTKDWFSGSFFHCLTSDYAIRKKNLSEDEVVEARAGLRWLEALK